MTEIDQIRHFLMYNKSMDGEAVVYKRKLSYLLVPVIVLVFVASLVGAYVLFWPRDDISVPKNIQESAGFYIPLPETLPKGWKLDNTSYRYEDGIVFYKISKNSRSLQITVQKKPETFDFKSFYNQGLSNASEFSTDAGVGAIGKTGDRTVGSVLIDESWVLTTTQDIQSGEMRSVLSSLK